MRRSALAVRTLTMPFSSSCSRRRHVPAIAQHSAQRAPVGTRDPEENGAAGGGDQQAHNRQPHVDRDHHHQVEEAEDPCEQRGDDAVGDGLADAVDRHRPLGEIAHLVAPEERRGEAQQPVPQPELERVVHRRPGAQQGHAPGELEEERADRQPDQRHGERDEALGLVLGDDLTEHEARRQRRDERDQPDHERGEHQPQDVATGAATGEPHQGQDGERPLGKGPHELDSVVTDLSGDRCVDANHLAGGAVDEVVAPSPSQYCDRSAIGAVPDERIALLRPPCIREPHRSRTDLGREGDGLDRRGPEQIFGMCGMDGDADRSADLTAHGEQLVVAHHSDPPRGTPLEHAAELVEGQLALELNGAGRGIDQLGLRRELLVECSHLGLGERDPGAVEPAGEIVHSAVGAGRVEPLADERPLGPVGGLVVEGAERDLGDECTGRG